MKTTVENKSLILSDATIVAGKFIGKANEVYPIGTVLSFDNTAKVYQPRAEKTEATDGEACGVLNHTIIPPDTNPLDVNVIIAGTVNGAVVSPNNGDVDKLHVYPNAKKTLFHELQGNQIILIEATIMRGA